ncbi:MAG: hypothetical protein ACKN9W_15330 [Methylococcus sp.]
MWIPCLYRIGLNLSNQPIGQELGLNKDDIQRLASQRRAGIGAAPPDVKWSGEGECDELYRVAGDQGNPVAVKKGRKGRLRRLQGACGRGTLEKEKPPVFGMIQRGGDGVIKMLENVQ